MQQLEGALGAVVVDGALALVQPGAGIHRHLALDAHAQIGVGGQRGPVDGVHHRLADAHVAHHGAVVQVGHQHLVGVGHIVHAGVLRQVAAEGCVAALGAEQIDLPRLERLQCVAGVGIVDGRDAVEAGLVLPPQRIGLQAQACAVLELGVPVGPRAAGHALVDGGLLHHREGHGIEGDVALILGLDGDGHRIRGLHALDQRDTPVVGIRVPRIQEHLIAQHHVRGRERRTVVKHDAIAQLEGPGLVLHRPAVRQQRTGFEIVVQFHHGFKHQLVQAHQIPLIAQEGVDLLAVAGGHVADPQIGVHIDAGIAVQLRRGVLLDGSVGKAVREAALHRNRIRRTALHGNRIRRTALNPGVRLLGQRCAAQRKAQRQAQRQRALRLPNLHTIANISHNTPKPCPHMYLPAGHR